MKSAEEWSRHYDSIHWQVIYIFTTIVAGLLGFSVSVIYNDRMWFIVVLGLLFTNLTVYFTASFREYRRALLFEIEDVDAARFLMDEQQRRKLGMWLPFVGSYWLLDLCWIGVALTYVDETKRITLSPCVILPTAFGMAIGLGVFLMAMYRIGKRPSFSDWVADREKRAPIQSSN